MKKTQKSPKKLSSELSQTSTFTNLTPRRGSLPGDYNRPSPRTPKFPLHSPTTPNFTPSPNHLNFSPLLEEKDYESILEALSSKGQKSSNELLEKLLGQKEHLLEEQEQKIK